MAPAFGQSLCASVCALVFERPVCLCLSGIVSLTIDYVRSVLQAGSSTASISFAVVPGTHLCMLALGGELHVLCCCSPGSQCCRRRSAAGGLPVRRYAPLSLQFVRQALDLVLLRHLGRVQIDLSALTFRCHQVTILLPVLMSSVSMRVCVGRLHGGGV